MVTIIPKLLLCCSAFIINIALSTAQPQSLFQSLNLINEVDPCEDVCQKTYPSHTYDESLSGECCSRGCRLYSIIELVGDPNDSNSTLHACFDNCRDAYPGQKEESSACILGCNSQTPFSNKLDNMGEQAQGGPDAEMESMLYPFLYMHSMYSNLVNTMKHRMSVSWSLVMQDGKGHFVLMKSRPQIIDSSDVQDFDDYSAFRGGAGASVAEVAGSDNTATEVLRHSQLKSARSMGGEDLGGELNAAETYWGPWREDGGSNTDWLSCIARKTGIPRLLLCLVLLLSAVAMIWLCMSAAVTAPEQKVAQETLRIYGDLEYLHKLTEKNGIKGVHPQDFVEARPLPVKIRVEQI